MIIVNKSGVAFLGGNSRDLIMELCMVADRIFNEIYNRAEGKLSMEDVDEARLKLLIPALIGDKRIGILNANAKLHDEVDAMTDELWSALQLIEKYIDSNGD